MTFTLPHDVSTLMAMPAAELPIGVIGAGAMGAGIAQVAAVHGHPVVLADAQAAALERARAGHVAAMTRDVEKVDGPVRVPTRCWRVHLRGRWDSGCPFALAPCTMVIEATVESWRPNRRISCARCDCVAAGIPPATRRRCPSPRSAAHVPARNVVGVHFFNPAPIMPLVEIISAISTARSSPRHSRSPTAGQDHGARDRYARFLVNRVATVLRRVVAHAGRGMADGDRLGADDDRRFHGSIHVMDMIGNDVNCRVVFGGVS
jgi:3-hydroxybutyryl-CoA dehydrogenase